MPADTIAPAPAALRQHEPVFQPLAPDAMTAALAGAMARQRGGPRRALDDMIARMLTRELLASGLQLARPSAAFLLHHS